MPLDYDSWLYSGPGGPNDNEPEAEAPDEDGLDEDDDMINFGITYILQSQISEAMETASKAAQGELTAGNLEAHADYNRIAQDLARASNHVLAVRMAGQRALEAQRAAEQAAKAS